MEKPAEEVEARVLAQKECMYFPDDLDCARLVLEWISKQQGIVCDLDLQLYLYDERVSFGFSCCVSILFPCPFFFCVLFASH